MSLHNRLACHLATSTVQEPPLGSWTPLLLLLNSRPSVGWLKRLRKPLGIKSHHDPLSTVLIDGPLFHTPAKADGHWSIRMYTCQRILALLCVYVRTNRTNGRIYDRGSAKNGFREHYLLPEVLNKMRPPSATE